MDGDENDDGDPLGSYGLAGIELQNKPLFDLLFSTTRPQLSDYTFASTFMWQDSIHLRWRLLHDHLCVFANGDGALSLLFPPVGAGDFTRALADGMEICRAFNADVGFGRPPRVEHVSETFLPRIPGDWGVEPMSGDYVYSTRKMIDLDGGELASKRAGRNAFVRQYDVRTERLGPAHLDQCLDLLRLWQVQVEQSSDNPASSVSLKRAKEVAATAVALHNAEALGLTGMVVYANDRLVGFTLGELLHDGQTCNVLIEKTDRSYRGSANYIASEFCRQYWPHTTWCNAGDDWEIPTLAWTKQSYRPAFRLGKYVVRVTKHAGLPLGEGAAARTAQAARANDRPSRCLGPAGLKDLDQLVALESQCFAAGVRFNRRQLRYLLRCPRATTYVIRQDGRVIASALLLHRRVGTGVNARLHSVAVEPGYRRQGLGRMLLEKCLATLRAEGVPTLHLEVAEDNAHAISLYESLGFAKVRRVEDYYGPGLHAWKMRAELLSGENRSTLPVASCTPQRLALVQAGAPAAHLPASQPLAKAH